MIAKEKFGQRSEARKGALIAKEKFGQRSEADYKKVLMNLYQINTDSPKASGRTSHKVVISSISEKPLPVYFASNMDQDKIRNILNDPKQNPFKLGFVVDVNVENNSDKLPGFYRVLNVIEIIKNDEQ